RYKSTVIEMSKKNNNDCLELKERLEATDFEQSELDSVHINECSACSCWLTQTKQLIEIARSAPQFDVSEELTQKILVEVQFESKQSKQLLTITSAIVVGGFLWFLFFFDSFETTWGVASWLVGLAALVALKFVIAEPTYT
ncbi:MAG: hypothetical protein K8F91_12750, partial [Candidatus Obscuribacterales bacterium]|nr:hypothetical protein [Candidatus Obscuribacterales bacterium]